MKRVLSLFIMILTFMAVLSFSYETVDAASLKSSMKLSTATTYKNSSVKITASASGGSGTKKYKYYYKLSGKTYTIKNYSTSKNVSFKPTKAGTYTVYVSVKDNKKTITKSKKLTVYNPVSLKTSLSSYVKKNTSVKITASSSGGKGTKKYKYVVYKNGKAIKTKNYSTAKTYTYKPTAAGTYTIKVTVKDSYKSSKTVSKTLYVYSSALSSTISYTKSPYYGQNFKASVTAKGGMGGYTYKFTQMSGKSEKVIQNYSTKNNCSSLTAKNTTYYIYVKDKGGKVVKKSFSLKPSINLSVKDLSLTVGTCVKNIYSTNIKYSSVKYSIDDLSICNVDSKTGVLMPISEGVTKVTVTLYDGSTKLISKSANIKVADNANVKVVADLSKFNDTIKHSIASLKANGVDAVIIRLGYGGDEANQDDVNFKKYVQQCIEENMEFGVYLYSYATDTKKAEDEASHINRLINDVILDLGAEDLFTLPIYYDIEDSSIEALSNANILKVFKTFVSEMNDLGYVNDKIGIYANYNWHTNKLTDTYYSTFTHLWEARYNSIPGEIYNKKAEMWQTGDGYMINGKNIDLSYLYL